MWARVHPGCLYTYNPVCVRAACLPEHQPGEPRPAAVAVGSDLGRRARLQPLKSGRMGPAALTCWKGPHAHERRGHAHADAL